MSRYNRQIAVPELGGEGQARLRGSAVLVVGAGGLAAPVLQYLAGAGLGRIRLVDGDRVTLGNLHRQTLFRTGDLGRAKVASAADHLRLLNPDCAVEPIEAALDPDNARTLIDGMDLVLDCADSFAVSYVLSDLCAADAVPLIHGSVVGTEGYAAGLCGGAPSLRAVFPDLPPRMTSCAEDGVLGPVVGVTGALQAQMAMAVLAGIAPSPLGRLVSYDGRNHRFGGFAFHDAPEPRVSPRFIAPGQITPADFVIDLRAPDEAALVCPHALRLKVAEVGDNRAPLPAAGQRAVLCCRSGLRAWSASQRLSARWTGEITLVALGDQTGDLE